MIPASGPVPVDRAPQKALGKSFAFVCEAPATSMILDVVDVRFLLLLNRNAWSRSSWAGHSEDKLLREANPAQRRAQKLRAICRRLSCRQDLVNLLWQLLLRDVRVSRARLRSEQAIFPRGDVARVTFCMFLVVCHRTLVAKPQRQLARCRAREQTSAVRPARH